jgi:LysR family transcriptional regulator, hypochlorite-specific transcription factor HypT
MGPGNKPLDLDWLEDFITLSETGNFSRAAEARAIAQPAFSRHIKSLEEWVGVALIDRTAHPVELTAAGKKFKPLVEAIVANLEAARIKAKAAHDQASASLRFASTHALSLTFFPRWLSSLETRLRLGPVQTMSDSFQACEDLMTQRKVQFLLCYGHANLLTKLDDAEYPVVSLGHDSLLPVTALNNEGQALYALESSEVLPILEYSDASGLGRILKNTQRHLYSESAQLKMGNTISVVFTAHNAFLLKTMTLEGRGIAWLPESLIVEELRQGSLTHAGSAAWQVPVDIRLYRQKSEMSHAAEEIWKVISQG